MFNVTRTYPAPNIKQNYLSVEVISELEKIFYGKCYLCERIVTDPEVDHFIPTSAGGGKYDWDNLYYSCRRCNSIKRETSNLLDCCDPSVDVSEKIKCMCPETKIGDMLVEAQSSDVKVKNTAQLLHRCYNESDTGIRHISRKRLHQIIYEKYDKFLAQSNILYDISSSEKEQNLAKTELQNMTDIAYPFSIFWKWHIKSEPFLSAQIPEGL